jgi:phage-related minor tail protein
MGGDAGEAARYIDALTKKIAAMSVEQLEATINRTRLNLAALLREAPAQASWGSFWGIDVSSFVVDPFAKLIEAVQKGNLSLEEFKREYYTIEKALQSSSAIDSARERVLNWGTSVYAAKNELALLDAQLDKTNDKLANETGEEARKAAAAFEESSEKIKKLKEAYDKLAQGSITEKSTWDDALRYLENLNKETDAGKKAAADAAREQTELSFALLERSRVEHIALYSSEMLSAKQLELAGNAEKAAESVAKATAALAHAVKLDFDIETLRGNQSQFKYSDMKTPTKSKGTSAADSARKQIADLRREISELNGETSKMGNDLAKKLEDIAEAGKKAGMSAADIQALQQQYQSAFQTKTLKDFDRELVKLTGDAAALRQLEIDDAVREWEQRFAAAGLSAEEAAGKVQQLRAAMLKQQQYKDLQTVANFYKQLVEKSGQYGLGLEYQNALIEKQAEAWREAGVPAADVLKMVELMKMELAVDPFSGFKRGLLSFGAEYSNAAKQVESVTTQMGSLISSTLVTTFRTGKFAAQDFFDSILDMAAQAAANMFIGMVFKGVSGYFMGGLASAKGNVVSGGDISGYSGSVVTGPTYFSYDRHYDRFASGAGLMGEDGPEGIFPLTRMSTGRLGIDASGAIQPVIQINPTVVNNTGRDVNAEVQTTPNGSGGFDMAIVLQKIDGGIASLMVTGRSQTGKAVESLYGLNRAPSTYK